MKKAFRWLCVILSIVTICAWAFLLHQAKEPWKLIGVNETTDSSGDLKSAQKQIDPKVASLVPANRGFASTGAGDRTLDPIVVPLGREQEFSETYGSSHTALRGPGPMAPISRHHHRTKKSKTDADSSDEEETKETEQKDDVLRAPPDYADDSRLSQMLISSNPLPSTSVLALLPPGGLSAPSTVNTTAQTLVERLTAPVGMTMNNVSAPTINAPRASLQSLVQTTQAAISGTSTLATIVGNTTTTFQSAVQTLTAQTLGTSPSMTSGNSSISGAVSSVTGTGSPIGGAISSSTSGATSSGSPMSPLVISAATSSIAPASATSTSSSMVSPSTSSFAVSPTSVSSTTMSTSALSSAALSPAVTTSVPTSLSSTFGSAGLKGPSRSVLGGH